MPKQKVNIYKRVQSGPGAGLPIQQAMGHAADVQERLALEAELGAFRAEANLQRIKMKPGYDTSGGHSYIEVEKGVMDWHVVLSDDRGLDAAMTIEYGRKAAERMGLDSDGAFLYEQGGTQGSYILHDAMNFSRGSGGSPEFFSSLKDMVDGE